MTKKHFVALAAALHAEFPDRDSYASADGFKAAFNMWYACVTAVADMAMGENGRFDRERFMRACGAEWPRSK